MCRCGCAGRSGDARTIGGVDRGVYFDDDRDMTTTDILFPDVTVELSGGEGNVYVLIGKVKQALNRAGHHVEASTFSTTAMQSESYDDVIQLIMQTVTVE